MSDQFLFTFSIAMTVTQAAVLATTIYLHRGLSHKSLTVHPAADVFFRAVLWLTTGQRRREWVAVHRKHHTFTDNAGDPHSPRMLGFWRVQLFNVYYYMKESRKEIVLRLYAPDIREDVLDRWIFNHGTVGVLLGTAGLCGFMGLGWGLVAAGIHAFTYVFVVSSSINGLCHTFGYKNFHNTAMNIRPVAWFTAGEGLHNNHHARPRAAKFSVRWHEFDPGWWAIKVLVRLRLIRSATSG